MGDSKLDVGDYIAVAVYFAAVIGAGLYVSINMSRYMFLCRHYMHDVLFIDCLFIFSFDNNNNILSH